MDLMIWHGPDTALGKASLRFLLRNAEGFYKVLNPREV